MNWEQKGYIFNNLKTLSTVEISMLLVKTISYSSSYFLNRLRMHFDTISQTQKMKCMLIYLSFSLETLRMPPTSNSQ